MAAKGLAAHSFYDPSGYERGAWYPQPSVRSAEPNSKQRNTDSKHSVFFNRKVHFESRQFKHKQVAGAAKVSSCLKKSS